MDQLGPYQDAIGSVGSLVFIAAQKRAPVLRLPTGDPVAYLAAHSTPFPFLLDESREVSRAYGVYRRLSMDSINIARPATFVVAPNRQTRYIYCGSDQSDRAPINQVLEIFQSISQQSITQH